MTRTPNDGWIRTYTGRKMYPWNAQPGDIDIADIAHALSQLCRFTGHTSCFYSVAEHSVHVAHRMTQRWALAGLLHDASEAYVGDLSSPLKHQPRMGGYVDGELGLLATIFHRFGLGPVVPALYHVEDADRRMLMTEQAQLMSHPDEEGVGYDMVLPCWSPPVAEAHFLKTFWLLRTSE